jgi:hypothetical protein
MTSGSRPSGNEGIATESLSPAAYYDHRETTQKTERGVMGWVFGMGSEKPGNIAGFAIAASLILTALLIYLPPDNPELDADKVVTVLIGIATLALGYLFGRGHRD